CNRREHLEPGASNETGLAVRGQIRKAPTQHHLLAHSRPKKSRAAILQRAQRNQRFAVPVACKRWTLKACSLDVQAVSIEAALCSPNSSMDCWRIRNFWILPVTVMGKLSTNLT